MILTSQIHRDGQSLYRYSRIYSGAFLQITLHFCAESSYTLMFLQITCLSFPMRTCLWVVLGQLCFNNQTEEC